MRPMAKNKLIAPKVFNDVEEELPENIN